MTRGLDLTQSEDEARMHQCGPLCPEHSDERDSSIDRPRALTDNLGHALDAVCVFCKGTGRMTYVGTVVDAYEAACVSCNGTGYVLTASGRTLLAFIRRHGS